MSDDGSSSPFRRKQSIDTAARGDRLLFFFCHVCFSAITDLCIGAPVRVIRLDYLAASGIISHIVPQTDAPVGLPNNAPLRLLNR